MSVYTLNQNIKQRGSKRINTKLIYILKGIGAPVRYDYFWIKTTHMHFNVLVLLVIQIQMILLLLLLYYGKNNLI